MARTKEILEFETFVETSVWGLKFVSLVETRLNLAKESLFRVPNIQHSFTLSLSLPPSSLSISLYI